MTTAQDSDRRFLKGFAAALAAAALLGAGFCGYFLFARARTAELPDYGAVADFRMTEKSGRETVLKDLEGHVWIGDFIFTRCGGQCPLMTQAMKRLHARLPDIKFVSFTSDPGYDTPEVLARYAEAQGAVSDRWLFLRGSKEELDRVTGSFHIGSIEEPLMHSTRFVLVDKSGKIRGYYDSAEAGKIDELEKEAVLLVRNRA